MTTNEVARKAGVSIGTLYEYFPHKDALVRELLDTHLEHAEGMLQGFEAAQFEAALVQPLWTSIQQLVAASIDLHAEDPALHRVLFEEARRLSSIRARVAVLHARIAEQFATLLAAHPEATCTDPLLSARLAVHAVDALVHDWVMRPDVAAAERATLQRELVRLVTGYCTIPVAANEGPTTASASARGSKRSPRTRRSTRRQ